MKLIERLKEKRKPKAVQVGDETIYVRPLTTRLKIELEFTRLDNEEMIHKHPERVVRLVVDQVCDEQGQAIFTEADIGTLLESDPKDFEVLLRAVFGAPAKDAVSVEQAKQDFTPAQC